MSGEAAQSVDIEALSVVTEYAVRYGDGEVEGEWNNPFEAEQFIEAHRRSIEAGRVEASDYEPMDVVCREVETYRRETPWTPAPTGPEEGR